MVKRGFLIIDAIVRQLFNVRITEKLHFGLELSRYSPRKKRENRGEDIIQNS